ncbi:MAG: HAD-IC family P-type ATPase [Gammaproteobacteria bacterium]|nr:HAD-IC family P-type ATPase [Gammaproteobacteria bacterium]
MKQAHTESGESVLAALNSSQHGLGQSEACARLAHYGSNSLPTAKSLSLSRLFLRQFSSPLIYVLLAAALVSLVIQAWSDAIFIFAVLMINALIGTIQEHSAQRAATALQQMVSTSCRVLRGGDAREINAEELVPGDIVLLESGDKVPADLRLLLSNDLECDESSLTGESNAVLKAADSLFDDDAFLGDRRNMAFAGTLVARGRGRGVVVATGQNSELGRIADDVLTQRFVKAPLALRMERFTHWVAVVVGVAALLMAAIALMQGVPFSEVMLLAVALAVSVIPEGLPVALTVALAIGMRRMARRNVIIRRLVAVEALGSCTFIATDKTGTLTVNRLTVRQIGLPSGEHWQVSGEAINPQGVVLTPRGPPSANEAAWLERVCQAAILPNEAFLGQRKLGGNDNREEEEWVAHGDAVDIALLVMAHKAGFVQAEYASAYPEHAVIPFESERLFAATLNQVGAQQLAFVKGAVERLLPMCRTMAGLDEPLPLDRLALEKQAHDLARQGYRVLALASGSITLNESGSFSEEHLRGLTLLGLIAMIDPLRSEAKAAIASCRTAGIEVAMVTGDHPATALAIARELNLVETDQQLVTGPELKKAAESGGLDQLVREARVFARIEPHQKLDIVHALQRNGHFVAVSGDGANDAPALSAAHVGIAMGKSGTDVARESAALIITDDKFDSIVAGVEEGRVAYANVRKVIFLLISTGAAELVLFTLALITGQPLPLLAVQLLWLNLVTNGIQDIALAFEPGEGDELKRPPRSPKEPIFNRVMVERVLLSALTVGGVAFLLFQTLLTQGYSIDEARNGTLLLMVLFENIHVFNCRSETRSALRHNPLRNPLLLFGTCAAQLIHIGAMYTPWISDVLRIEPVSLNHWLGLLSLALTVLVVMELYKALKFWLERRQRCG